jgi:hypothetical protein
MILLCDYPVFAGFLFATKKNLGEFCMDTVTITGYLMLAALAICIVGIISRLREILTRPFKKDLSRERGSIRKGVLYAFTLGMAPWEKESTRIHWIAYLRGIFFHVGIFVAFAVLMLSPWIEKLPPALNLFLGILTALGAIFGFSGILMRWMGKNERVLSVPDDYFSVFLAALFTTFACAVLISPALLPVFYLVSAILLVYIPISKIRHCLYFFYSKFFFGANFGRRGVIGHSHGEQVK